MSQPIVLASTNQGKLREMSQMLSHLPFDICSQDKFELPEAAETGSTFVENAIIKARHACLHTQLPAISDDSGLAVDALNGAPGIFSARYAGQAASDQDNLLKLISELKKSTSPSISACFHCVIVFMRSANDPAPTICHGTWEGEITLTQKGTNGFGYDPIFYVREYDCTSAELPAETKNKISHRGMAMNKLLKHLETLLS